MGELQDSIGIIEIRIHNAFKAMFLILMLMPVLGFGISVAAQGLEKSIGIIIPMTAAIVFIRFVVIEISFRFISKSGFNKLARIIGIENQNSE